MPARFIDVDRQTPMFLPYDLREWVLEDHIVHFIPEAVEQIPHGHFQVNHRGTGSEQFPPTMMLALLIYCYATGRFGSRPIEAASYSDVAVRYLCANQHPDHDTKIAFNPWCTPLMKRPQVESPSRRLRHGHQLAQRGVGGCVKPGTFQTQESRGRRTQRLRRFGSQDAADDSRLAGGATAGLPRPHTTGDAR